LKAATAAARDICVARFEAFGCAGQASRIAVLPLGAMAQRYAAGDAPLRHAA
jgi:fructose-bisphosphate aldolase class II